MRKTASVDNELFDRFWKAYPRKEGKPGAMRTFEKLKITAELLERILDELQRQAKEKDWEHINKKFIPMAQTWLNRRDWGEERNGTDEQAAVSNPYRGGSTVLR